MTHHWRNFMGAKLALFIGSRLLLLHRDETPGLLWPGHMDLPGGGREGDETALQCAQRETCEEFSLSVPVSHIRWGRAYTNSVGRAVWFFVGTLPETAEQRIVLGDEGQGWRLFSTDKFLSHERVVPQFKPRLRDYLNGVPSEHFT